MRPACLVVLLASAGCTTSPDTPLRFEPEALQLTVDLDAPGAPLPLRILAGDTDVTAEAQLTLRGAPLGTVDAAGFTSDGRTGGRAEIVATLDGATGTLPVRVVLRSTRLLDAPAQLPGWFAAARDELGEASLEPGDGAVLPPNLGRLDVHFAAAATDDAHELALLGPELDLRVYAAGPAAARTIELTPAEWDAVTRTSLGQTAELVVRSLASQTPATARRTAARLAITELPFAEEVLFTGKMAVEPVPQIWSYRPARASTERWANGPAGSCLGCHIAVSRDGRRIAAGGSIQEAGGPIVGGGVLLDARTRYYTAPPSAAVGDWVSAAFDPGGDLVTTNKGVMTLRDGATALPRATLTPALPANQPAISPDGRALAYVAGPIDLSTTQPSTRELRIHDWDAATATLGASRTLVPAREGAFLKLPDFSPDNRWVVLSRLPALFRSSGSILVVRADGTAPPIELTPALDDFARFASPLSTARGGAPAAEPMMWIVMKSYRPLGPSPQADTGQLWAMAFYPERGLASRPFHLPGQRRDVAVLHAPQVLPPAAP